MTDPPPLDEKIRELESEYTQALGRVAQSWNYLHEMLGQLFATIVGADRFVAEAIWYSVRSDLAQREMLRAAIVASNQRQPFRFPTAKDDLTEMIDKVNFLSVSRNDAIHAPISIALGPNIEIIPAYFRGNPRAMSLLGKDILKEFAWYEARADVLSRYVISCQKAFLSLAPWPDKLLMPLLTPNKTQKRSPRQTPPKQSQPPPESSQA